MTGTGDREYPSPAMRKALTDCQKVARTDSTVLLLGESGSGKDFLAQYTHKNSKRSTGPFFAINCAAVSPNLAESELFGHERGAFTGSDGRKWGLVELAENGTLLLNEIGELSLPLQAKLLTFLDTRKITRVGGVEEITVNARIIAATNRDLKKEVAAHRFRQDLFYRLNVVTIIVPPLRERHEDIPILVEELMVKLQVALQLTRVPSIDTAAVDLLQSYSWPGNVRELRNVLEKCLILTDGWTDEVNALIVDKIRKLLNAMPTPPTPPAEEDVPPIIAELLRQFAGKRVRNPSADQKKRLYKECIVERQMKQVDIARKLGVSPSTVCKWLQSLGEDGEVRAIQ